MRCYRTYNDLLDSLNTTKEVKETMKAVKREHFVKEGYTECDKPLLTIENQTISAPHMHAKALEYLYPVLKEGSEVLEVKDWGKRRLAYEINDFKEGFYNIVRIKTDNNKSTDEFQRLAKINDDIIRYIVIREDQDK